MTPERIWERDLDAVEAELDAIDEQDRQRQIGFCS